jgi:hypothetical protein
MPTFRNEFTNCDAVGICDLHFCEEPRHGWRKRHSSQRNRLASPRHKHSPLAPDCANSLRYGVKNDGDY